MKSPPNTSGKYVAVFVSGDLRLELFPNKHPALSTTIKLSVQQCEKFKDTALASQLQIAVTKTMELQNVKYTDALVQVIRFNLESSSKGGYFGRIILQSNTIDYKSTQNLRQCVSKIKRHVVEITGYRFVRIRT